MVNRITKQRISSHLNYDWIKYLCIILAVIVLWSILFSFFGPKLQLSEQFEIVVYSYSISTEEQNNFSSKVEKILRDDIKVSGVSWLAALDKTSQSTLDTLFQSKQGDVFILANEQTPEDSEEIKLSHFATKVDASGFADLGLLLEQGINLKFDKEYQNKMRSWAENNNNITDVSGFMKREEARVPQINAVSEKLYNMLSKNDHYENGVKKAGTDSSFVDDLAFYYKKYEQTMALNPKPGYTVEEEKLWGVKLSGSKMKKLSEFISNGLDSQGQLLPINYVFGLSNFSGNIPFQFEGLFVLDVFLETYK